MKTVTLTRSTSVTAVKIKRFTTRGQVVVDDGKGEELILDKIPHTLRSRAGSFTPGDYLVVERNHFVDFIRADDDQWIIAKKPKKKVAASK